MTKAALLEENKVLEEKNILLEENYLLLKEQGSLLEEQNRLLKQELAQIKQLIFGSKRERFVPVQDPMQSSLFGEDETQGDLVEITETKVVKKKKISRKGITRNRFPENMERRTTTINPPDVDLQSLSQIGKDVTELLAYRPASLFVKEIIRPRLVDKNDEDKGVLQAPIPARIVPKGMVDESLIAEIISEKIQF